MLKREVCVLKGLVQKTICLRLLLENIWRIGIEILNSAEDVDIRWYIQQRIELWFVQNVITQCIQELCQLSLWV